MVFTVFCQKAGKEIPLGLYSTCTGMVPLLERLLFDAAAETGLRQFCRPGVLLLDFPASVRGFAGELSNEQTGSTNGNAPAEVLLE